MIFKLVFSSHAFWKWDWVIYFKFKCEFQTKLHLLQDEIQRLKDIQRRLEKARDRGDKELPPWLVEHEQFQQLLTKVIQFLKLANCFMFPHVSSWKIGSHCLCLSVFLFVCLSVWFQLWFKVFSKSLFICYKLFLKMIVQEFRGHSWMISLPQKSDQNLTPPHHNGHLANQLDYALN